MDSGPAALIQIGAGLQKANAINGELAKLQDPERPWCDKLDLTSGLISSHHETVLLCDEPERWPIADDAEARHASYNNGHTKDVVHWLKNGISCRRVVSTPWANKCDQTELHIVPQMDLPLSDLALGPLQPIATDLKKRLGARLSQVNFLEMRLLVAFAAVTSTEQAVSRQADWPNSVQLAHSLVGALGASDEWTPVLHFAAKVALARGPVTQRLLEQLGSHDLNQQTREALIYAILQPLEGGFLLHPVLKTVITSRVDLGAEERFEAHRSIMAYYRDCLHSANGSLTSPSECELEGFYHAAGCGERDSGLQAFSPDQLHTLGRVLSRDCRDYDAAADIFRQAIQWDDQDDYAHHYLAYNLDCAAGDRQAIREEYLRAVDLNAEHPWWWSRWINFLITTGRLPDAKQEWSRAMNALGIAGGRGPDLVYEALHLWVARLLLHRAQLDFADEVLAETPQDLRSKHTGFRALDHLLEAMKIARHGRGVFPANVDPKDYWKHPHLKFPKDFDGKFMLAWNPARVENIDDQTVHLVVGKHDAASETTTYGHIDLPIERFDAASMDEKVDQLTSGRLLELGFYGDEGLLRIRIHPDQLFIDPDLPFLDPPNPRRYLEPKPAQS